MRRIAEVISRRADHVQPLPPVVCLEHWPTRQLPDRIDGHDHCEEGLMRQRAWDAAAETFAPDWIITGDLDEWPTPDLPQWLATQADPRMDTYYLRMLNMLSREGASAIMGHEVSTGAYRVAGEACIYAPEHPGANKKGIICRRRDGQAYRYDVMKTRHTRMEPNPPSTVGHTEDATHHLIDGPPYLLHWRWWHWGTWLKHPQSATPKARAYWAPAAAASVPSEYLRLD